MAETFTEQERHAIDDLHKREFQNMTAEEVALYTRWVTWNAQRDAEFTAKIGLMQQANAAKIELMQEQAALAKQNLNELRDAALARLAAIDGA